MALTLALLVGLAVLFGVATVYGTALIGPSNARVRRRIRGIAVAWGIGFVLGTLLLSRAELPTTVLIFVGPDVFVVALLVLLVGGVLLLWRALGVLALARMTQAQVIAEAGRDKALERQIRALVREQRALNRRQQEITRAGEKPAAKPH